MPASGRCPWSRQRRVHVHDDLGAATEIDIDVDHALVVASEGEVHPLRPDPESAHAEPGHRGGQHGPHGPEPPECLRRRPRSVVRSDGIDAAAQAWGWHATG